MLSRLSDTYFLRNMEKIQFFVHISITCISGSNKNLFWALTDFSDTKQDICHLQKHFCSPCSSLLDVQIPTNYIEWLVFMDWECLLHERSYIENNQANIGQWKVSSIPLGTCASHQSLWKKDKIMGIAESICILPSKQMKQPRILLASFLVFLELNSCFM